MYNNPYMMNNQQDLITLRERIDRQLNQINNTQPQQTPITQNFQLAPSNQTNGIRYVNSVEDVKKEFVINDTLFVNKEYSYLWLKEATGEVKTYKLDEIVELDEKDLKIAQLEAKLNTLLKEIDNNAKSIDTNDDEPTSITKSSNVSNVKPSKK